MRPPSYRRTLALLLLLAGTANAQSLAQKAQADSLFDEAKRDMVDGKFADACRAFEASYKLVERLGTELNLADCYAKIGRSASAWAAFREAQSIAAKNGDGARADVAKQQAADLEPKLDHVVIQAPEGTTVSLDEQAVDPLMLGRALPVDTGSHTIKAGAFSKTVEVTGEGQTVTVEVKAEVQVRPPPPPPPHAGKRWTSLRVAAVGVGGTGVVLLGTTAGLAIATLSTWSGAKGDCPNNVCNATGVKTYNKAAGLANAATVTLIAGSVCVAAGAALWLAGKPHAETIVAPTALRGGAGLVVQGSF
jgi:hypothetical protein